MNKLAIIELARSFLISKVSALQFSENICVERRKLSGLSDQYRNILDCGEELFMAAEVYNPDADRDVYELDEAALMKEVEAILKKFNLL